LTSEEFENVLPLMNVQALRHRQHEWLRSTVDLSVLVMSPQRQTYASLCLGM